MVTRQLSFKTYNKIYSLQYGFQQYALEPLNCGDSFSAFHQDNLHYLALSDGMGQGKMAANESKLTLESTYQNLI